MCNFKIFNQKPVVLANTFVTLWPEGMMFALLLTKHGLCFQGTLNCHLNGSTTSENRVQ